MRIAVARPTWSGAKSVARTVVIVSAIGLAISVASVSFSASRKSVPLRLEVALHKPTADAEVRLQVKLTNATQEVVSIDELDLPWIAPNELEFLDRAYRHNTLQGELQKKGPMEDYFGRKIDIQPGQSLTGILKLQNYFSGLKEALMHSDVTVEWNCQSGTLTFVCNEGEQGRILLHKKPSGQKKRTPVTP